MVFNQSGDEHPRATAAGSDPSQPGYGVKLEFADPANSRLAPASGGADIRQELAHLLVQLLGPLGQFR